MGLTDISEDADAMEEMNFHADDNGNCLSTFQEAYREYLCSVGFSTTIDQMEEQRLWRDSKLALIHEQLSMRLRLLLSHQHLFSAEDDKEDFHQTTRPRRSDCSGKGAEPTTCGPGVPNSKINYISPM